MNKQLTNLEVKNAVKGEVQAVFSTFNQIDHDKDVTVPGAFTAGAPVRISAYGHASHSVALPAGKGRIRTTPREAILDGRFFLDTTTGRDTFITVKEMGDLQEWSYGYVPVKFSFGEFAGEKVRFLEQVNVVEVSPVLQGAGVNTRTLSAKCDRCEASVAGQVCPEELAELRQIRDAVELRGVKNRLELRTLALEARKHLERPYSEVAPDLIPAAIRSAAAAARGAAAADLGIAPPSIRWFEPARGKAADFTHEKNINGLGVAGSGEIWLRSSMGTREAASVAAHEVAHLAGFDEDRASMYEIKQNLERMSA